MTLDDFINEVQGFANLAHAEKIKLIAWHLHEHKQKVRFSQADIRLSYDALNLEKPSSIGPYLNALEAKKPKQLLSDRAGFYLPKPIRDAYGAKYGRRSSAVAVDELLTCLPAKIGVVAEKVYLDEALICFRNGAFRASIVMTWNLTFDHLCNFIISKHLASFNSRIPLRYPKKTGVVICVKDDFEELKESETIELCSSAGIVPGNVAKILSEKLTRRNLAAHPSGVVITQLQAEDFISDLVQNVVLKLI